MDIAVREIITSFIGTFGFSLALNVRGKKAFIPSIGGGLSWCLYLLLRYFEVSDFISYLFASMFVTAFSEIMAQITKTPSTVYLLPASIPLLPGGSLFYTMSYFVGKNNELFLKYANETLHTAFALASGVIVVSVITINLRKLNRKGT